jgi:hypothetical protein
MKPGLLPFGFVSAQSQGFQTCSFAKASPKGKIPDSEWLQFFLNRSKFQAPITKHQRKSKLQAPKPPRASFGAFDLMFLSMMEVGA